MVQSARRAIGTATLACAVGLSPLLAPGAALARSDALHVKPSLEPSSLIDLDGCSTPALSKPFISWWDFAEYELTGGGDFEGPGWTLSGGAQLAQGSEPYAATGTLGAHSLSLPAGASAQSPLVCVDAGYPSVRFFIAGSGVVAVSLVDDGLVIPAGIAVAADGWWPTPVMLTESPVLATLAGGSALVSVRLTTLLGDPQVDDVFIDPWSRGG